MTVSASYTPLAYSGNGVTVDFSVTWPFFTGSLLVTAIDADGVETAQTLTTHYTVDGGTTASGLPDIGTVTMVDAPASGVALRIERATARTQATSYANGDAFPAKTVEAAFDKALLIAQEARYLAGVALQIVSSGATDYWDAQSTIIRNLADGVADTDAVTLQQLQDAELGDSALSGAAQGSLLYRGASGLTVLAPGSSGQFLKTQGASADPIWAAVVGGGDMLASNNLSDLANKATARTTLGVAIGSDVQAYDADLTALAGVTTAADKIPYFTGSHTAAVTDFTATARSLLDDASTSAMRTTLGVAIGSNVQAYDANLTSLAGLATAADKYVYTTGVDTWAQGDISAFARTVLDDASAATFRTTLGVGTSDSPQFTGVNVGHASDTPLTRSSAGVVACDGHILKQAGKETIWIPAAGMYARTTSGAATGAIEMATNFNVYKTFDFDATTAEHVQFIIHMPKSWDLGTFTYQVVWSHAATTVDFGVVWQLQAVTRSDGDVGDVAFGTLVNVVDTGGTTDTIYISAESTAVTPAGSPATDDIVHFQFRRGPTDPSDTMAIDARLIGLRLFYTSSAANDD